MPGQVLTPVIYVMIIHFYTGQPQELVRFSSMILISIILSLLAQSIGECTSAIWMNNQGAAVFAGGFIPLPMILFGGFLCKISRMPVYLQPISWFSFLRWAFEAMLAGAYGFDRCEYNYREFLKTVNASAVVKPLWAQTLPLMLSYLDRNQNSVFDEDPSDLTEEEILQKLYSIFGGNIVSSGGTGIDLNKSMILSYFEIDDYTFFTSTGLLLIYMIVLKISTYYILLAKLHSTK